MIDERGLAPYYFPTTVVFIDDDRSFLDSLSLSMPDDLAFRVYTQPRKALQHIQEVSAEQPVSARCFSVRSEGSQDPSGTPEVTLDLEPIRETLYTEQRFTEVSVVVIDYDMPAVNGLEICRQLQGRPIKMVLLTGKADETVAIEAFNEGLIDHFISKGQPGIMDHLPSIIQKLQRDYFRNVSGPITHAMGAHARGFLSDPAFVAHFKELAAQHHWVEYYLSVSPSGLLCLDAGGRPTLLVVADRERLEHYAAQARRNGAPTELVSLIQSGEVMPSTDQQQSYTDWRQTVALAHQVPGSARWFLALVEKPDNLKISPERLLNYDYYLEILDYMSHSGQQG